jgi:5-methylcytosine-specific restriction endonuclease McrA
MLNNREVSSDPEVRRRVKLLHNNMCAAIRVSYQGDTVKRCKAIGNLRIDHIIEIDWDGLDIESNLQPLCITCHERKTYLNSKRSKINFGRKMQRVTKQIPFGWIPETEDDVIFGGLVCEE